MHDTTVGKNLGIPLRDRGGNAHGEPRFGPHHMKRAKEMLASGDYTVREIAEGFGFTPRTIYRHLAHEDLRKSPGPLAFPS